MDNTSPSNAPETRLKVARLIAEYGLDGIGAELERHWTSDGDDRMSLRDLDDYFNQQLLETAMTDAGMNPLAGEVENTYRLLQGDGSSGDQSRTRRQLEREGIETDTLQRDFVSYQAIRTYLKDHREVTQSPDDRDRIDVESNHIQRLRGRTATVTTGKLEQLENGAHLDLGEFRVLVEINVICEDCGSKYTVEELLERGGCDCSDTTA